MKDPIPYIIGYIFAIVVILVGLGTGISAVTSQPTPATSYGSIVDNCAFTSTTIGTNSQSPCFITLQHGSELTITSSSVVFNETVTVAALPTSTDSGLVKEYAGLTAFQWEQVARKEASSSYQIAMQRDEAFSKLTQVALRNCTTGGYINDYGIIVCNPLSVETPVNVIQPAPTTTPQVETWSCINYGTRLWRNPAMFPESQGYLVTTTGNQTPESEGYSDCTQIN